MQYSSLNNNLTTTGIEARLNKLEKSYNDGRFSDALNILLSIISEFPNKLLVKSKCQVAILVLKSNAPTET